MRGLLPPFCLLIALSLAIAGFALLAVEPPSPSVDFHRARTSGDDGYADVLEANLHRRQLARKVLVGSLFGGSVIMTVAAFATMRPAGK